MTTIELIQWAAKAQDAREASWKPRKKEYGLTLSKSREATAPANAADFEHQLVDVLLFTAWNEVQGWSLDIKACLQGTK